MLVISGLVKTLLLVNLVENTALVKDCFSKIKDLPSHISIRLYSTLARIFNVSRSSVVYVSLILKPPAYFTEGVMNSLDSSTS